MEIIKKNLILFIVLTLTVIASAVLLVFVLIAHSDMIASVQKIDEIKAQIVELQRQKPAPGNTNLIRINKDTENFKRKLADIYHYFGITYYDAFQAFVQALGMNEETFMSKFRDFWSQNAIRGSNTQQLFIKFMQSLDQDKLSRGRENFRSIYQKQTLEKINDANINDIIFYTIGVNRPLSPAGARSFLTGFQEELLRVFDDHKIAIGENVSSFTFSRYFSSELPRTEDIPAIIEISNIIGDVCIRAAHSGISRIDSISRGPLDGTGDGKFIRYRVNFDVAGDMASLRKFLNSLEDAYKVNRIYVIRNLSFEQVNDRVSEFTSDGAGNTVAKTLTVKEEQAISEAEKARQAALEKVRKAAPKKDFSQEKSYGKAIFGGLTGAAKLVKMSLEMDYVMFVREKFTIQE